MSNELTTIEHAQYPLLGGDTEQVQDLIRQNCGELRAKDLPKITTPTGESEKWLVHTVDGEDHVEYIEGVVLHLQYPRVYFPHAYGKGDSGPPACSSPDSVIGFGDPGWEDEKVQGNGHRCHACPKNEFGTSLDPNSSGKACKEQAVLIMLRPQRILPTVLRLGPTAVDRVRKYMTGLSDVGAKYHTVVTRVGLEKGKAGLVPTFKRAAVVPEKFQAAIEKMREMFQQAANEVPPEDTPGTPGPAPANDSDKDDIPY
jgi:hypothetical protein